MLQGLFQWGDDRDPKKLRSWDYYPLRHLVRSGSLPALIHTAQYRMDLHLTQTEEITLQVEATSKRPWSMTISILRMLKIPGKTEAQLLGA